MMLKNKTEDKNYYQILNISPDASQQQIEKAYQIGKSAYSRGSMALYSLIDEKERQAALEDIKEAYKTLSNLKKRKNYDTKILKQKTGACENAYFRNSYEKIIIEDGNIKTGLWKKIKKIFYLRKK